MNKLQAHKILTLWKSGTTNYPAHIINLALYTTGDLDGHTC